jgi:hypothetical protein
VTLKQVCVSGGKDGPSQKLEMDLEILHWDPDGFSDWDDFTRGGIVDWVPWDKEGCNDINKIVRPLAPDDAITVRLEEHDSWQYPDKHETILTGVCESVDSGDGQFSVPTEFGTFTFMFEGEVRYSFLNVKSMLLREWPHALFLYLVFIGTDDMYKPISDSVAEEIYTESGLEKIVYTDNVFDCEDFSTVYKGAASLHAYKAGSDVAYAVGMIAAEETPNSARFDHAANFYINDMGQVKILEPQNGSIIDGSEWSLTPAAVMM